MMGTVRVLLAALVTCGLSLLGAGQASAHPPPDPAQSGLVLSWSAAKDRFRQGEPVLLDLMLTNNTGQPCALSAVPDGTLTVLGLSRDGVPVRPSLSMPQYSEGLGSVLARSLRRVDNGTSISAPLSGVSGLSTLASVGFSPSGDHVQTNWPVGEPGMYEISLRYALPSSLQTPERGGCRGVSNTLTLCFFVEQPAGTPPATPTDPAPPDPPPTGPPSTPAHAMTGGFGGATLGIGAVLLVLLPVALWLVYRSRRQSPGLLRSSVALLVMTVLLGGLVAVSPGRRAEANLGVFPGAAPDFTAQFNECMIKFTQYGGAADRLQIIPWLQAIDYNIVIYLWGIENSEAVPDSFGDSLYGGRGTGSTIFWNPKDTSELSDGVLSDPCGALYHELFHAYQNFRGQTIPIECNRNNLTKQSEIAATFEENHYRRVYNLPPRKSYGGVPLPKSLGECGVERIPKKPSGPAQHAGDCKEGCARSDGDPHLTTFDGLPYDFQATGEFVAVQSTVDDLRVQTRQAPWSVARDVSINTAVAMNVAGDRVGVYHDNGGTSLRVNGAAMAAQPGTSPLPAGGSLTYGVTEDGAGYLVTWPDGSKAWITSMDQWGLRLETKLAPTRRGQVSGLLGNFDGNPDNDLAPRGGGSLPPEPRFDQLYPGFADSWRINQDESLFDYAPGQHTGTFTDRALPANPLTAADIPNRAQVEAICKQLGVTAQPYLNDCVLDVAITGQPAFGASAASSQAFRTPTGNPPEQPLPDGARTGGTLAAGGTLSWPLDLGQATVFRLINVVGTDKVRFTLQGPSGADAPGFSFTDPYIFRVQPGAQYRLHATSDSGGTFEFQVLTLKDRRANTHIGDTITGRLDVAGRADLYSFTGPEGAKVILADGQPCDDDTTVSVIEDGPQPIAHTPYGICYGIPMHTLEAGKRYVLAVWSDNGDRLTNYRFHLTTE